MSSMNAPIRDWSGIQKVIFFRLLNVQYSGHELPGQTVGIQKLFSVILLRGSQYGTDWKSGIKHFKVNLIFVSRAINIISHNDKGIAKP